MAVDLGCSPLGKEMLLSIECLVRLRNMGRSLPEGDLGFDFCVLQPILSGTGSCSCPEDDCISSLAPSFPFSHSITSA